MKRLEKILILLLTLFLGTQSFAIKRNTSSCGDELKSLISYQDKNESSPTRVLHTEIEQLLLNFGSILDNTATSSLQKRLNYVASHQKFSHYGLYLPKNEEEKGRLKPRIKTLEEGMAMVSFLRHYNQQQSLGSTPQEAENSANVLMGTTDIKSTSSKEDLLLRLEKVASDSKLPSGYQRLLRFFISEFKDGEKPMPPTLAHFLDVLENSFL